MALRVLSQAPVAAGGTTALHACRAGASTSAERIGKVVGQLVEVIRELDVAAQGAVDGRNQVACGDRYEPYDGLAIASDDDLLAGLGTLDELREPRLGLVHSYPGHGRQLWREGYVS